MKLNARKVLLAPGAIAAVAVPTGAFAAGEGNPTKGGARNPSSDTRKAYTKETEFISNTSTYGTRQSNKSDNGGGAVYGCRSKPGGSAAKNEPCLRGTNLADGLAFEFATGGLLGGTFDVGKGGDTAKPFTTNATGVATGLNADRVDGRDGADLLSKTDKAGDADKVDGVDGADLARAGDLLFARVAADGTTVNGARPATGVTAAPSGATDTTVTFGKDVSACSFTATQGGGTATAGLTFSVAASGTGVTVSQAGGGGTRAPFHLQVIC